MSLTLCKRDMFLTAKLHSQVMCRYPGGRNRIEATLVGDPVVDESGVLRCTLTCRPVGVSTDVISSDVAVSDLKVILRTNTYFCVHPPLSFCICTF